jgi:putative transposase
VRKDGVAYVPRDVVTINEIMRSNHNDPWQGGHFGRTRTQSLISKHYWWPGIALEIRNYVAQYDICQRVRIRRYKSYDLFQPFSRPTTKWKDISMNFITGLPPLLHRRVVYDAILVVMDRYSAITYFIFCTKDVNSKNLAGYIYNEMVKYHGMLIFIVTDRESVFTSKWWIIFCHFWSVKARFSTAFYP